MSGWHRLLIVCLLVQPAIGWAQTSDTRPVPTTRQLSGLNAEEASALVAQLENAQRQLRAGEFQGFELVAGSIASYDAARITPRDAFLQVRFNEVWAITRGRTDNRLWRPYRLSYSPNGLGRLYWDIEVALGINGNLQRVLMIYQAPAPF